MKKLFVLLGILCALCFLACSNFQLAGGDMGVVSLAIGDELAREIRSAASLRSATGGSYTLTASIRGEYSDSQTVTVANGNYSGVTFTFEGIPVGKKIILDLTAKAGSNYIWYGNSGKHTVERGENLLTIALGRVSGVLMWDSSSVKIARYGNYETSSNIQNPKTPPVWCFDAQGNLYVMDANGGGMRYNLRADGTYPSGNNATYSGLTDFWAFACDNDEGIVYGIDRYGLYRLVESNNPTLVATHTITECVGFAMHENIMYIASYYFQGETSRGIIKLSSFKWETVPSDDGSSQVSLILQLEESIPLDAIFSDSAPTGQMIYHEGALYLLLGRQYIILDSAACSVGAVVKINAQTLKVEKDFGQQGYLGLVSSSRKIHGISCYAPTESNDTAYFYGPMGFAAIMPKKLVIADSGYAMSAGNALVNLSKKRRIVTVDLETESFSSVYDIDGNFYEPQELSGTGFENVN